MKAVEAARERLAARHAGKIRRALRATINTGKLVRDFESSHPVEGTTPAQARAWVKVHAIPADKELNNALRYAYADAWVLGVRSANELLKRPKRKNKAGVPEANANVVSWDNWKPGEAAASALLKPPNGLQDLLSSRMTVIKDINNTTYDRLGTQLSTALEKGLTNEQTASLLDQVMNDPARSLMIARTETARASSIAARNTYETSGVEYVEWLVAEGCDDCKENEDASPIPIDATFPSGDSEPPAHPNCMCSLSPYVVDTQNIGGDNLDSSFNPTDDGESDIGNAIPIPDENGMIDYSSWSTGVVDINGNWVKPVENIANDYAWTRYKDLSPEEMMIWLSGKASPDDLKAFDKALKGYGTNIPLSFQTLQGFGPAEVTFEQNAALYKYTGNGYDNINKFLRDPESTTGWQRQDRALVQDKVKYIDEVFAKAPPIENDLISYRGLASKAAEEIGNLNVGATFSDDGFISTSFKISIAEKFSIQESGDGVPKVILEILNPKGSIGLDLNGLQATGHTQEQEWLLPRGTKFEVISKTLPDKENKVYMKVKIV